ncbi:MAG TPA: hypothetical protein VFR35_04120 [Actinoplanes sp.]|nr:hypothetical protein [Actinoplanes sp.]
MLLWVLTLLLSPTPSTSLLVLGLAVVAVALLIALAAAGLVVPAGPRPLLPTPHRAGADDLPRLLDPGAPGRPRPRAPAAYPAAV